MLDLFFADDSSQPTPTRDMVRPLISAGGIRVPSEAVAPLERSLAELCAATGFPEGPEGEFKWSFGRELWMRTKLIHQEREEFFVAVLDLARAQGVEAAIVIVDPEARPANRGAPSPQI